MTVKVELPTFYREAKPLEVKNRKEFDIPGVYVFYDAFDNPLYVGKTISFKRRFVSHTRMSPFFSLAEKVRLYEVANEYEKDIYETHLIYTLRPEYNRAKSFYHRADYEEMLQEVEIRITETKYEIQCIESEIQEIIDFDEDEGLDSTENLGEILHLQNELAELEYRLKKLHARKGTLRTRLSA